VLVVGLGQLGLPVAKYVKQRGFDTYGYDLNPKAVETAEKTSAIKKAVNFSDFDVFIICVSTHKPDDMFSPQIDGLLSVVDKISKEANRKDGALISIESTIPKGTSKKVFELLNHRFHIVHAPHRWYALEEKEHGVNQLRVVGGVHDCCLEAAMQFYNGGEEVEGEGYSNSSSNNSRMVGSSIIDVGSSSSSNNNHHLHGEENNSNNNNNTVINPNTTPTNTTTAITTARKSLGIPMHPVSKIEIAEVTKIIENAHRYLQIAFAEDLYLYCQANNINFSELRDALNTKWNVNILEPREGIGGHCLPKDTKMFLQSSSNSRRSNIITAAMDVDRDYKTFRTNLDKGIIHSIGDTTIISKKK
jgi:UDP-N-acetyl-D-mannosaminuronic acid dehydrogenase